MHFSDINNSVSLTFVMNVHLFTSWNREGRSKSTISVVRVSARDLKIIYSFLALLILFTALRRERQKLMALEKRLDKEAFEAANALGSGQRGIDPLYGRLCVSLNGSESGNVPVKAQKGRAAGHGRSSWRKRDRNQQPSGIKEMEGVTETATKGRGKHLALVGNLARAQMSHDAVNGSKLLAGFEEEEIRALVKSGVVHLSDVVEMRYLFAEIAGERSSVDAGDLRALLEVFCGTNEENHIESAM